MKIKAMTEVRNAFMVSCEELAVKVQRMLVLAKEAKGLHAHVVELERAYSTKASKLPAMRGTADM